MGEEEKQIKINCVLRGQVAKKFQTIKEHKGLCNNTEVVRLIINEFKVV